MKEKNILRLFGALTLCLITSMFTLPEILIGKVPHGYSPPHDKNHSGKSAALPLAERDAALFKRSFYRNFLIIIAAYAYPMEPVSEDSPYDSGMPPELKVQAFHGNITILRVAMEYGLINALIKIALPDIPVEKFVSDLYLDCPRENIVHSMSRMSNRNTDLIDRVFIRLFGMKLIQRQISIPSPYEDTPQTNLLSYNPRALKKAFDRLYVKPDQIILGQKAQILYDVIFKSYIALTARHVARVLSVKGFLQKQADSYRTQAQKDPDFNGYDFAYQAETELMEKTELYAKTDERINPRLLGTLIRRAGDNTLPVLLQCLERILRDYDPMAYDSYIRMKERKSRG